MTLVQVAAVVDSADELLPAAWQLIDDETAALEADPDVAVACAAGCNACCEHAVVVTPAETRAICGAVAALPVATQALIAARARQILQRVADELLGSAAGHGERPRPLHVVSVDIASYPADFAPRYYALQEPCLLLVDGACSVRSVRPLVCREYLMSSAPEHCFDPALERAVRIRRRRDVSSGFEAVSSRFGEADQRLLPVALLGPLEPAVTKPMSGPKLARLLHGSGTTVSTS